MEIKEIAERYEHNVPWLEKRMAYIRHGAYLVENGIYKDYGTPLQQAVIKEYIECKTKSRLKVRGIPSGNITWCVYDEELNEAGEYSSEEEARKAMPRNGLVVDADLDEMYEIVDENGKNVTGMLYPTETRAWVFLYGIIKPEMWRRYIAGSILLELLEEKGGEKDE